MLSHHKESIDNYLWTLPHGEFSVETRRIVREDRFNKYARIPVVRTLIALYFIALDDAYLRPHKPDPSKPQFYRWRLWRVHNCGQRKDGTFLTAGNVVIMGTTVDGVFYDSSKDISLGNKRRGKDLPR